jgi:hypothetical protein
MEPHQFLAVALDKVADSSDIGPFKRIEYPPIQFQFFD